MSFLRACGPRRVRLVSVQALLALACGQTVARKVYGEGVHKWLRKHWSTHLTQPERGLWALKRGHDLLPDLGLAGMPEMAQRLRKLIRLARERGLEAQHLAALVYGLQEGGVTRSELHQHPWTSKRHKGQTVTDRFGYMLLLESLGLVSTTQRPSTSRYPFTVWHTTPKGRALILGEWMRKPAAPAAETAPAAPALRTARGYVNLNAA